MNILVTGGAGYIGSHMVKLLLERGHRVTVLDDLSTGHAESVLCPDFVVGSIADPELDALLQSRGIEAVLHFAARIQVGESVQDPGPYYATNVAGTLNLLECMRRSRVRRLVFSSTAAVYGMPIQLPMPESHPKCPINPYGGTKWMVEQALAHYRDAYGLRAIALWYFNAAGADPDGRLGSRHVRETHLVPLIMQALSGRGGALSVFGDDYPTRDGTCVRDYVHVSDLCEAHLLALTALERADARPAYNLGSGIGCTVLEALDAAQRVVGRPVPFRRFGRRAGDPPSLLADPWAARTELGWTPRSSDIDTILGHAWAWELAMCDAREDGAAGIAPMRTAAAPQGAACAASS